MSDIKLFDYTIIKKTNVDFRQAISESIKSVGGLRSRSGDADMKEVKDYLSKKTEAIRNYYGDLQQLVVTQEMSMEDADRMRADDDIMTIAPQIPLKLIKPVRNYSAEPVDGKGLMQYEAEYKHAWGLSLTRAMDSRFNGEGIRVCILDSGIDASHPCFAHLEGRIETNNFTNGIGVDTDGHGTHCAGTIFGKAIDGVRIGVAPNIERALVGKVIGSTDNSTKAVLDGIMWGLINNASVISMSIGYDFDLIRSRLEAFDMSPAEVNNMMYRFAEENNKQFSNVLRMVADYTANPCIVVAASGNDSNHPAARIGTLAPASNSDVVSVGAIDIRRHVASFSNVNPLCCGPGVDVYSALPNGEGGYLSGTSMATPHAAGVAALWAQKMLESANRIESADLFKQELLESCSIEDIRDKGLPNNRKIYYGRGVIQAPIDLIS